MQIDAASVGEIIAEAERRFGSDFAAQVQTCRVWVNGEPASYGDPVSGEDEIALLPPVSGG